MLNIDGQKVTRDKSMDILAGFNPYNVEIAPNGKFALVSHLSASKCNADIISVIDPAGHELPPETPGEIVVRGPNVFFEYWVNRDELFCIRWKIYLFC